MFRTAFSRRLAAATFLPLAAPAGAATTVGTIDVELNVTNACLVNGATAVQSDTGSAGKILFPTQPGVFGDVDAQLSNSGGNALSILCSPGATPSLTVGAGTHDAAGVRRLAAGATSVAYRLFTDSARSSEIGIGQQVALGAAGASAISVPIYARVNSAGAVLPAGKYTDTVQVTLSW